MRSYDQYCGLAVALDHVGERWTLLIVRELLLGPRRFSNLVEGLPGIASNLLTERLKGLEADGLVERRELPAPANATAYALTELGEGLRETVHALVRWSGHFMLERRPAQCFQARWLGLAFEALVGAPTGAPVAVKVTTPDGEVTLQLANGRVQTAEGARADVLLQGEVPMLLGAAAGLLPPAAVGAYVSFKGQARSVRQVRGWLVPKGKRRTRR